MPAERDAPTPLTPVTARGLLARVNVPDVRRVPESGRRRGQFRAGWRRAVLGKTMGARALRRITWNNLGYRAAAIWAPRFEADDAYAIFEAIFLEDRF